MRVRIGFIPLVDCAVILVAARHGFFAREGIAVELSREASWASLRDKLTAGALDAAHMLGPIPVASQLGLGPPKAPMVVPFALSAHGNAVSVSGALWEEMALATRGAGGGIPAARGDVAATAAALAAVVRARAAAGRKRLVFGIVHPLSSHNFALRYVLASAGVDPDRDVTLTVVPPPFVVAALAAGEIDGFCVGAPWSEVGAAAGVSRTVIVERDIFSVAPEKVLALREERAERDPALVDALVRALKAAAGWTAAAHNRAALVPLLAMPDAVGVDAGAITAALASGARAAGEAILFDASPLLVPRKEHALWFYAQMVRWGLTSPSAEGVAAAQRAYRPDLFVRALGGDPGAGDASGDRSVAAFDGAVFDPARLDAYLAQFPVQAHPARGQPRG